MTQCNPRTEITLIWHHLESPKSAIQIFKYAFVSSVNDVLILVGSQPEKVDSVLGLKFSQQWLCGAISRGIKPCSPLKVNGRFGGKYRP
jgi:hypothetical protein